METQSTQNAQEQFLNYIRKDQGRRRKKAWIIAGGVLFLGSVFSFFALAIHGGM